MDSAEVRLDPPSLEISGRDAITGRLTLIVRGVAFPDSDWNDFVEVVIGWWIEALVPFVASGSSSATLRFMDGPYEVRLMRPSGNAAVALEQRAIGAHGVQVSASIDIDQLVQSVRAVANAVLEFAAKRGHDNADTEVLRRGLRRLPPERGSDP